MMHSSVTLLCTGVVVFLSPCVVDAVVPAQPSQPHVLLILADDYGYAHFGVHRREHKGPNAEQAHAETHTTNLDSLADEGILLDRHYAYKICAPSRSSLQSGRLAVHVNDKNLAPTIWNEADPVSGYAGIPRNMTGLAKKLRQAGYRTHAVGKWDAGMATPEHTPLGRGYESWLGYYQHSNAYYRKSSRLMATGEIDICLDSFVDFALLNSTYHGGVQDPVSLSHACMNDTEADPACYEEHIFKTRAIDVINAHDPSEPLFLFYSFHLLHVPLQVPLSYLKRIDDLVAASGGKPIDTVGRRYYNAMVLYMDDTVGELVQAVKAKNMWDNTLLVFMSDNGGPIYENGAASNHPLKGGKFTDWEGGIRTNAFLSGGFLPKEKRGTRFQGVISIADWYGTICELAGVDQFDHNAAASNEGLARRSLPQLKPVDSVAQWGFILNNTNGRAGPLHLSSQAVLQWPYKLVVGKQPYSTWTGELYPNCSTVHGLHSDQGPVFTDFKVLDVKINWTYPDSPKADQLLWAEVCQNGCLFNVEEDPAEHHDLAKDPNHNERLQALKATLTSLNSNLFAPDRGDSSTKACDIAIDQGGYLGPFVDIEGWYSPLIKKPTWFQRIEKRAKKSLLQFVGSPVVKNSVTSAIQAVWPIIRYPFLEDKVFRLDECIAPNVTDMGVVVI